MWNKTCENRWKVQAWREKLKPYRLTKKMLHWLKKRHLPTFFYMHVNPGKAGRNFWVLLLSIHCPLRQNFKQFFDNANLSNGPSSLAKAWLYSYGKSCPFSKGLGKSSADWLPCTYPSTPQPSQPLPPVSPPPPPRRWCRGHREQSTPVGKKHVDSCTRAIWA